ncbi:DUF4604 domain-containing protein [Caerostris extrusa]|uniref:DUF4604 domain-containing protein n=1 Tax=Caerostris extrusa TaxID=172846 RepID=A0AAV4XE60_CAEEX|nr:DUF4604 domain-containing protein [Caerostris extrusa]
MPKRSVAYIKPEEPSFIKKMKAAMGYQEPDTVETKKFFHKELFSKKVVHKTDSFKKEVVPFQDDQVERDDEKPVVVVLSPDDLTEEEAKTITEKADVNKKIIFTKPVKKTGEEKNSLDFSSKKRDDLQKKLSSQRDQNTKVKNTSLLSFDDEEEDEEDMY